jgi:RHS repeat-associated protein
LVRVTLDTSPGWQPFGFAGGLYDADSGLVRFVAKDYDAVTGKWTAKDPELVDAGVNLHAYVGNDPVNFIEPAGTNRFKVIGDLLRRGGAAAKSYWMTWLIRGSDRERSTRPALTVPAHPHCDRTARSLD